MPNDLPVAQGAPPAGGLKPLSERILPPEFYDSFITKRSKERIEDPIRSRLQLEDRPGTISMLAGKPNPETYPMTSLQFTLRDPVTNQEVPIALTEIELERSLQYSGSKGIPEFLEWLVGLQEFSHGRKPGEGWDLSFGAGSSDLIHKAILALLEEGDSAIIESPVYAGVFPVLHEAKCDLIELSGDENGIDTVALRKTLENWPKNKRKPKLLYTIPFGCNPTGVTSTIERRLEVLGLAREHNFLIFEDDPYYYLYFGSAPRPPSYFALEVDQPEVGRVVRLDSLSKVLSAGMRIGFLSAPQVISDAVLLHTMGSNLQPPTFTQVISWKLLSTWGYAAYQQHVYRVADFYRTKRDEFARLMDKHLTGLAEWTIPEAGMFFWFKLLLDGGDEGDSEALIRKEALEGGILALPGTVFLPSGGKTAYVRASFSLLPETMVDEGLRRLRVVLLKARGEA
ncbi:PLP-dependent transferase [Epithele typhae]|uniref:PLP-dependent transferase n=1 Tax=Epithele typhae TaxID=378194 RepID=UPI002008DB05|nr:PLP-dependent transferase [Epithele typhae]KAH9945140.1 PLP-dependent transferase [Epithele typhae]